jgi:hypothetical protein
VLVVGFVNNCYRKTLGRALHGVARGRRDMEYLSIEHDAPLLMIAMIANG